ncbi:MAG: hypothetical protein GOMPHAMPRED_001510 [Gomphillus americanus]|uniref:Uncharacterized protein n=1 Tax=Gomphillus americanus TaxID=1940652 RepID=A0A8H3IF19_9LECA|nr:MAG: hypothetical protein GOMPHAMPRED_001510 [Gomphillus americanus]
MTAVNKDTTGLEVATVYATEIKGENESASYKEPEETTNLQSLAVVTGPSQGIIGGQTVLDVANFGPKEILLAGRTLVKIQPVIDAIKNGEASTQVTFVPLDLADLLSVRKAAQEISSKVDQLDVLINNAGGK